MTAPSYHSRQVIRARIAPKIEDCDLVVNGVQIQATAIRLGNWGINVEAPLGVVRVHNAGFNGEWTPGVVYSAWQTNLQISETEWLPAAHLTIDFATEEIVVVKFHLPYVPLVGGNDAWDVRIDVVQEDGSVRPAMWDWDGEPVTGVPAP